MTFPRCGNIRWRPGGRGTGALDRRAGIRPHLPAARQERDVPRGAAGGPPETGLGRADRRSPGQALLRAAAAGPGRAGGAAALHRGLRRIARAGGAVPRHRAADDEAGRRTGKARRLPLCRHPFLPDALRLLQLCQPVGGKEHEADGAVSGGAAAGSPRNGGAGTAAGPAGDLDLHGRRHADDADSAHARPALRRACGGI